MSYDLMLMSFKDGDTVPVQCAPVLRALRQFSDAPADAFGWYVVEFGDGSRVEFAAEGLESNQTIEQCAFHLRSFTPEVMSLVYAVARAGDFALIDPQGEGTFERPMTVLVDAAQESQLGEGYGVPRLADSAVELAQALGAEVADWQAFRDEVMNLHRRQH